MNTLKVFLTLTTLIRGVEEVTTLRTRITKVDPERDWSEWYNCKHFGESMYGKSLEEAIGRLLKKAGFGTTRWFEYDLDPDESGVLVPTDAEPGHEAGYRGWICSSVDPRGAIWCTSRDCRAWLSVEVL